MWEKHEELEKINSGIDYFEKLKVLKRENIRRYGDFSGELIEKWRGDISVYDRCIEYLERKACNVLAEMFNHYYTKKKNHVYKK